MPAPEFAQAGSDPAAIRRCEGSSATTGLLDDGGGAGFVVAAVVDVDAVVVAVVGVDAVVAVVVDDGARDIEPLLQLLKV